MDVFFLTKNKVLKSVNRRKIDLAPRRSRVLPQDFGSIRLVSSCSGPLEGAFLAEERDNGQQTCRFTSQAPGEGGGRGCACVYAREGLSERVALSGARKSGRTGRLVKTGRSLGQRCREASV